VFSNGPYRVTPHLTYEQRGTGAYMLCCDNVLLRVTLYLWDTHAIEVNVPTTRMEGHSILMAHDWLERVEVASGDHSRNTTCWQTVAHSLSGQSNIITTVYECS